GPGAKGTVVDMFPQMSVLKYAGQIARGVLEGDPEAARDAAIRLGLSRGGYVPRALAMGLGTGYTAGGTAVLNPGKLFGGDTVPGLGGLPVSTVLNLTP